MEDRYVDVILHQARLAGGNGDDEFVGKDPEEIGVLPTGSSCRTHALAASQSVSRTGLSEVA